MVDPTRKRQRASKAPMLSVVASPAALSDPLRIVSQHRTSPAVLDLNEFADGTLNKVVNYPQWTGGFKGRPELIAELAPYYRAQLATATQATAERIQAGLRAWWRLLDATDHLAPVSRLEHLNELHGALAAREGFTAGQMSALLRAANPARVERKLPTLVFEAPREPAKPADLPDKRAIAAIYHDLKNRVRSCQERFQRADTLAAQGALSPACNAVPLSEATVHFSYRAHAAKSGNPVPAVVPGLRLELKAETPELQRLSLPVFGCFPSKADVQAVLLLFLLKTGWNAQTALDLAATGPWLRKHPTSAEHHLVVGTKSRGNSEQVAVGLEKSELSPGRLIQALLERTKPLREKLFGQLAAVEAQQAEIPSEAGHLLAAELRRKSRSPWLFVDPSRKNAIGALKLDTYAQSHDEQVLRKWIREANEREARRAELNGAAPYRIPESITISDFRDAFIAFSYESSGFNWLVAKLAAGHASIESLKTYLRHRQWRAHGERQVSNFQEALWAEIQQRRIVDPAILRGLVERGEVTEAQRQRWADHKDRTRVGMGCKDFRHPPKQVVPDHTEGAGCRVQRCTLCPLGVVFNDSLGHLARRLAELQVLQEQMPLTSWFESSFPEEVDATNATLALFEPGRVQAELEHWRTEIREGRHRVLQFEGSYE